MNLPAENPFWQLVDGIVVINLDQRPDRWSQFQETSRGLIPAQKLQRLAARLGREIPGYGQNPWFHGGKRDRTWAARAGCTVSHRQALAAAREAGWNTVLIFEDDVAFSPDFQNVIRPLADALARLDWQVCYLGFTDPWSPARRLASLDAQHTLYQVYGCSTGHAYLVRARARDWLLAQMPTEANIWPWVARHRVSDRWYQRQLGRRFPIVCVSPGLVHQAAGFSDIVQRNADYLREHQLEVTSPARGALLFTFEYWLRRMRVQLGLVGDVLRGWTRRINGF